MTMPVPTHTITGPVEAKELGPRCSNCKWSREDETTAPSQWVCIRRLYAGLVPMPTGRKVPSLDPSAPQVPAMEFLPRSYFAPTKADWMCGDHEPRSGNGVA